MTYLTYLKNKNLSKNTIEVYYKNSKLWLDFLSNNKPNKRLFVKFINDYAKNHSANTVRLMYSSVLSYMKYIKNWKLYNEFQDIKLPVVQMSNKTTISLQEYNTAKERVNLNKWFDRRNWLVFSFMFFTGIRGSEIKQINKSKIINNQLEITGKGNKTRIIFIPNYLMDLLKNWRSNKINIARNGKQLTYKQLNVIIKKVGKEIFNKSISSHSLRRSYATNLLRNNIDLKTVSKLLGHSNINTTSRYIFLTNDEIVEKIQKLFDK